MLYTVFDTETTGLNSDCDILSFSYVLLDDEGNIRKGETLYFWKEGVTKWNEEAYDINHLSKEFLRQFEDEYEVNLKKMQICLSMASLVGYNSGYVDSKGLVQGFDYPRCKRFLERNGIIAPTPLEFIDVMMLAQYKYGRKLKLVTVAQREGISEELVKILTESYTCREGAPHDSMYDTIMTALLYVKFLDDSSSSEEEKWYLYFSDDELRAVNNRSITYSLKELEHIYPDVFNHLISDPESHLCTDTKILEGITDV